MVNKITIMLMLFLLISTSVGAINGYVALDYNSMKGNLVGQIRLYEDIGDLRIGGHFTTDLTGISLKDNYFPAGVPKAQYYGLFLEYEVVEGISLRVNEWCNHWFAQSEESWAKDTQDITVGVKIEFDNLFSK